MAKEIVPAGPIVPSASVGEEIVPSGQITPPSWRDTAADVGKAALSGVGRGASQLVGLPGTVTDLLSAGITKAGKAVGVIPESWNAPESIISGENLQEKLADVTGGASEYRGKTTAGKYAGTVGEFAPGAAAAALTGGGSLVPFLGRTAVQSVVPGVASEFAGQAAQEYLPDSKWAEPAARVAGAMLGGIGANTLENSTRGLISPGGGAAADDLAHAARLREAGIDVSAGLATKSPKVLGIEANNPKLQAAFNLSDNNPQYQSMTTAALREAGLTDEMIASLAARKAADPSMIGNPALASKFVMDELRKVNGQMFDDALSGIDVIPLRRLSDPVYAAAKKPNAPSAVEEVAELLGKATRTGATVPARDLHRLRSELGKDLSSLDGSRAEAAAMARDAIDDLIDNAASVGRSPEKMAMLDEARRRHQALLVMDHAIKSRTTRGASGVVTPQDLAGALERVYGRKKVVTGNVNRMGELAESGINTFGNLGKPTASGWRSAVPFGELLFGGAGALGILRGAAMSGTPLKLAAIPAAGALGVAGLDAARRVANRQLEKFAHTKPVQRYLENQLANPTTGISKTGAALRAGAAGYPSYDDRVGRKAGGRVGGHEFAADQLVRAAERAKKDLGRSTEPLLSQSDDAVAHALEVANKSI